jgi:hypothetical protein
MTTRTTSPSRGAREMHLCDWPFGGVGRRLLLEALLIDEQPDEGWMMGELEARALVKNGGLNTVLPGAVHLGLVWHGEDGRWHVPKKLPAIAAPLRKLTIAAVELGEEVIPTLVKREYKPRSK